jgi:hypothetical protein
VNVEYSAEEIDHEEEVFAPVRKHLGPGLRLLETLEQIGNVLPERSDTVARRLLADEIRYEQWNRSDSPGSATSTRGSQEGLKELP